MEPREGMKMAEVWYDGKEAVAKLKSMGLEVDDLVRPLDMARADAQMCTSLDAPSLPAITFWSRSNRYIREVLTRHGWAPSNRDQILRTVSPEKDFAITAISGTGQVGVVNGAVRTRNPKGAAVAALVRMNAGLVGHVPAQPFLPMFLYGEGDLQTDPDAIPTWFLLYKLVGSKLFLELSLPVEMVGKYVNCWAEHIVIPPIDFDGSTLSNLNIFDGPDDDGPEVFVERIA